MQLFPKWLLWHGMFWTEINPESIILPSIFSNCPEIKIEKAVFFLADILPMKLANNYSACFFTSRIFVILAQARLKKQILKTHELHEEMKCSGKKSVSPCSGRLKKP